MTSLFEYLRETRSELAHVSWPTQTQTIVYTVFVALLSIGIALYLGVFDYIFTSGITRIISLTSPTAITSPAADATSTAQSASTTSTTEPTFTINPLSTSTTK